MTRPGHHHAGRARARQRDLLRRGAVLVDERNPGTQPRVLFFLEHAIQDASLTKSGERRVMSKRLLFVEIGGDGAARHLNYAPYLDYRPLQAGEPGLADILARTECGWISRELEGKAQAHAIANVVPEHLAEVRERKVALLDKTEAAVKERLTKEINYWDFRAEQLKDQERAGKPNARLNSGEARKRADELQARLQKRMEEIKQERQLSPLPPVVLGGVLVVPAGYVPVDRGLERLGYDIESAVPGTGRLRFIEVKGRVSGAETITVTKNEILYSLNKPDDFILAIVEFLDSGNHRVHYLRRPFHGKGITTEFSGATVNFSFAQLIAEGAAPSRAASNYLPLLQVASFRK